MPPEIKQVNEDEILSETPASDTLKPDSQPAEGLTKAGMMASLMGTFSGLNKSQMVDFFNASMAQFGPNVFPGADAVNNADKNKASIAAKVSVKEDVEAMLNGEEISEEFKVKVETLFEAAVNAKLQVEIAALEEETEKEFISLVEEYKEEITEKVDEYLTYAVEEWVKENKLAIENGLKLEIFESFFGGLKNLFVENNISIPDDEVSLVGELETKVETLETKVNEQIQKNIAAHETINELTKQKIQMEITEGLSANQKEKFSTLSESIEFDTEDGYRTKLNLVKETYFNNNSKPVVEKEEEITGVDNINEQEQQEVKATGNMALYAQAIERAVKNK